MRRRGVLIAVAGLAGCAAGDGTPTPTPTSVDHRSWFRTSLSADGVEVASLRREGDIVHLVHRVADPDPERVREDVRRVAGAYARAVGSGWEVARLAGAVRADGRPVVTYFVRTAWAEAFNRTGDSETYGNRVASTVERVTPSSTAGGSATDGTESG